MDPLTHIITITLLDLLSFFLLAPNIIGRKRLVRFEDSTKVALNNLEKNRTELVRVWKLILWIAIPFHFLLFLFPIVITLDEKRRLEPESSLLPLVLVVIVFTLITIFGSKDVVLALYKFCSYFLRKLNQCLRKTPQEGVVIVLGACLYILSKILSFIYFCIDNP